MRVYINTDQFAYIEIMNGVTARQFSKKFGIGLKSAQTWLSRWKAKGYLVNDPSTHVYKCSPDKWWGQLVYDSEQEDVCGPIEIRPDDVEPFGMTEI